MTSVIYPSDVSSFSSGPVDNMQDQQETDEGQQQLQQHYINIINHYNNINNEILQQVETGREIIDRRDLTKHAYSSIIKDYQKVCYHNRHSSNLIQHEIAMVCDRNLDHIRNICDVNAARVEHELLSTMDMSTQISLNALQALNVKLKRYEQQYKMNYRSIYSDIEASHDMQFQQIKRVITECIQQTYAEKQHLDEESMNLLLYNENRLCYRMEKLLHQVKRNHSNKSKAMAINKNVDKELLLTGSGNGGNSDICKHGNRTGRFSSAVSISGETDSGRSDSGLSVTVDSEIASQLGLRMSSNENHRDGVSDGNIVSNTGIATATAAVTEVEIEPTEVWEKKSHNNALTKQVKGNETEKEGEEKAETEAEEIYRDRFTDYCNNFYTFAETEAVKRTEGLLREQADRARTLQWKMDLVAASTATTHNTDHTVATTTLSSSDPIVSSLLVKVAADTSQLETVFESSTETKMTPVNPMEASAVAALDNYYIPLLEQAYSKLNAMRAEQQKLQERNLELTLYAAENVAAGVVADSNFYDNSHSCASDTRLALGNNLKRLVELSLLSPYTDPMTLDTVDFATEMAAENTENAENAEYIRRKASQEYLFKQLNSLLDYW